MDTANQGAWIQEADLTNSARAELALREAMQAAYFFGKVKPKALLGTSKNNRNLF